MINYICLMVLCILAVIQDIRSRKIKNQFNVLCTVIGFLCVICTGEITIKDSIRGLFFAVVLGILMWKLGIIRAGDAKFMWCIGVLKGWKHFGISMIYTILLGGVMALGIMLVKRDAKRRFVRLGTYLKSVFLTKKMERYEAENPEEFPFSIPLALGCFIEFFIRGV